jgi:uncharacterized protein DUF4406
MKVYLGGPMRGIPLYNFPAFDAAAAKMRESGDEVISPADLDRAAGFDPVVHPEKGWQEWTRDEIYTVILRDIEALRTCDRLVLLPGWEHSTGVAMEMAVARMLGIPVFKLVDGRYHERISWT